MIPASFTYRRAGSIAEALSLLGEYGDEAKVLAGGHSLLPLMKLRFAVPEYLVDIGRLDDLSYVREDGDTVAVGALTRHHDLQTSDLLVREVPLLAHAAGFVGDPQVRHRGTLGGSLVHGDAASDLSAVVLALNATMIVRGPGGVREIPASEFFADFFETAVEPDELLTEVRIPKPGSVGWAFEKFNRRAIDWAVVGVAVLGDAVGLVNMGPTPLRASAVEAALAGGATPAEAAEYAAEGTSPADEATATADYRRHLARVLTRRALERAHNINER